MKQNKILNSIIIALIMAAIAGTSAYAKGNFATDAGSNNMVPPPPNGFKLSDAALQAASDVLGITTDELSTALDAGTTLEELATTAGVDVTTVFDAIRAVMPPPSGGFAGGGQSGNQPGSQPGGPGTMQLTGDALQAVADALGLTTDEVTAALDAGTTLEELATTAGVDFQTVMDAFGTAMPAPNGQPGNQTGGQPSGQPGGFGAMQLTGDALQAAADALGLTTDEVTAALDAGTTLEELASTAGVDFQTVMDAIRAAMPAPSGQPGNQTGGQPNGQPGGQPGGQQPPSHP